MVGIVWPNVSLAIQTPGFIHSKFFSSHSSGWHHTFKVFLEVQMSGICPSKYFLYHLNNNYRIDILIFPLATWTTAFQCCDCMARNCDSLVVSVTKHWALATKFAELVPSWWLLMCPTTKDNHNTTFVFKLLHVDRKIMWIWLLKGNLPFCPH